MAHSDVTDVSSIEKPENCSYMLSEEDRHYVADGLLHSRYIVQVRFLPSCMPRSSCIHVVLPISAVLKLLFQLFHGRIRGSFMLLSALSCIHAIHVGILRIVI